MWIDPDRRAAGIGGELVDSVIGWARNVGAEALLLSISQDDRADEAAALYRSCRFLDTGGRGRLRSDPAIVLAELSLVL
jgi:GNAT superfamily N-acetyltransferase